MNTYRMKPVEVEAFRWGLDAAPEWFSIGIWTVLTRDYCEFRTLDGVVRAERGDWIVKDATGAISLCRPSVFNASYESACNTDAREETNR